MNDKPPSRSIYNSRYHHHESKEKRRLPKRPNSFHSGTDKKYQTSGTNQKILDWVPLRESAVRHDFPEEWEDDFSSTGIEAVYSNNKTFPEHVLETQKTQFYKNRDSSEPDFDTLKTSETQDKIFTDRNRFYENRDFPEPALETLKCTETHDKMFNEGNQYYKNRERESRYDFSYDKNSNLSSSSDFWFETNSDIESVSEQRKELDEIFDFFNTDDSDDDAFYANNYKNETFLNNSLTNIKNNNLIFTGMENKRFYETLYDLRKPQMDHYNLYKNNLYSNLISTKLPIPSSKRPLGYGMSKTDIKQLNNRNYFFNNANRMFSEQSYLNNYNKKNVLYNLLSMKNKNLVKNSPVTSQDRPLCVRPHR